MIPENILEYTEQQLVDWLRNEAGSSNPDYFHAKKAGSLKLQQVPEEYSKLLMLLRSHKIESYLELGIGNGGSFAVACYFMKETLKEATAVDCLAYRNAGIGQNEKEINGFIDYVEGFTNDCDVAFHNQTTDEFFAQAMIDNKGEIIWDAIFIDADHSHEGAKRDYDNAINFINKGGLIIFHDINSKACPGIMKLWSEVKQGRKHWEFIASQTCGIGVIQL